MKTKKCGLYAALAAVLLITAMLVITCTDPLTSGGLTLQKDGEEKIFTPPPGKALLRVIIPSEPARTLLPTNPNPGNASTVYYFVEIALSDGSGTPYGNGDKVTPATPPGVGPNVWVVTPGTYTITVLAHLTSDFSDAPFAGFQEANKAISGSDESVAAALTGIFKLADGTTPSGKFSYAITLPSHLVTAPGSSATMTLAPIGSGSSPITNLNLLADNDNLTGTDVAVPAGYYRLTVKLEKRKYGTVTYSHIVHIHGNQSTVWPAVSLNMSKIAWDVTLGLLGGTAGDNGTGYDNGGLGWPNASLVDKPTGDWVPEPPTSGDEVLSWHTSNTTLDGSTVWNFATKKIYESVTLYPRYGVAPTSTNLTVTITAYVHTTEGTFTFENDPPGGILWSDDPEDQVIDVTVGAPYAGGTWYFNGVSLGGSTLDNAAIESYNAGKPLAEQIDLTVADAWYEFTYEVTVSGTLRSASYSIVIGPKT
jgi:hypothetical protein